MAKTVRYLLDRDGRYFARIVVPPALRLTLGKTELRAPLGSDRRTALRALPSAVAGLQDQLRIAAGDLPNGGLSSTPLRRPLLSAAALSQAHYDDELRLDTLTRGDHEAPPHKMNPLFAPAHAAALARAAAGACADDELGALIGWAVDRLRERGVVRAEPGSSEWRELAMTLAGTQSEIVSRSLERDRGNFAGEPRLSILRQTIIDHVSLAELVTDYFAELRRNGRGAAAEVRWRPAFADLRQFVGHDDAALLSRQDVQKWIEHLRARLTAKTIRDTHLGALRAVLTHAVDRDRLPSNVAAGVKVRVPRETLTREKGLTEDETRALFAAATNYHPASSANPATRESSYVSNAKRWAVLLAIFSGGRISEITQLRREDVREAAGITYIRITPEAGSVKDARFRDVPLHPQLIELGFLAFVQGARPGPLFFDSSSERRSSIHPSKFVARRLASWIRSLKIIPTDVAPLHGLRHRFKTLGRELGVDANVLDAIQGHAPRSAGDAYGSLSLKAKWNAIERFPAMRVA